MEVYFYANNQDLKMLFDESICDFCEPTSTFEAYEIFAIDGRIQLGKSSDFTTKDSIIFYPCWISHNYLQPAHLYLEKQNDKQTENYILFSRIRKAIKNKFMLSKDKTYYIGPSIYLDWLNRKYRFPNLFNFDCFEVEAKDVDTEFLFDDLKMKGYIVRSQKCYLINEEYIAQDTDHYVVFKDTFCMEFSINGDTKIYEYGSECIHIVGKRKRGRKIYSFVIDKRLSICESYAVTLYNELKQNLL